LTVVERGSSVVISIVQLFVAICIIVISIQGRSTHQKCCVSRTGHRLVFIIVHWTDCGIIGVIYGQAVEMGTETINTLTREDAKYISLMFREFYMMLVLYLLVRLGERAWWGVSTELF
jgi:hypothetical protein